MTEYIQDVLNFRGCTSPQFKENGLGKIGTTGFMIGLVGGTHFGIALTLACFVTFSKESNDFVSAMVHN
jgi:hypothetical protein